MQTTLNNTRDPRINSVVITGCDSGEILSQYRGVIADLDDALAAAAAARLAIDRLHRSLEHIESSVVLTIEGGNAETRKAKLTLALADTPRHEQTVAAIDTERTRLLDAERRATVAKERARLLRAVLALRTENDW